MLDNLENHMVLNTPDAPWNAPDAPEDTPEEHEQKLRQARWVELRTLECGDILIQFFDDDVRSICVVNRVHGDSVEFTADLLLGADACPQNMLAGGLCRLSTLAESSYRIVRADDGPQDPEVA